MKVNIYETVEVSDQQRVQLAVVLDDGRVKPKRQATRDEIKAFVWEHGAEWPVALVDAYQDAVADAEAPAEEDEEDILAGVSTAEHPLGDIGADEDLLGSENGSDDEAEGEDLL